MLDKFFKFIEKLVPAKYRWILNHDGFKRYFRNTGWMFGGQMFSLLVSFFIGVWLARYLGPENFGVLSYAVAFVGLFSFISSLGVDGILGRELIKFPEKRDELLGTAFYLKLIGGLMALAITIVSALLFSTSPLIKLLIILFSSSFIFQAINVINSYFYAEVKSKNNIKAVVTATTISSLLKIIVILLNGGVIWIVAVYVVDSFLQGAGFMIMYKRYGLKIKNWFFNKSLAKDILKDSWPLMLASAASFIFLRIDQVMIGALLGEHEVGLYAAAVRLVEVWYFIPGIICGSLFPAIVNAKKNDLLIYKKRLKALYLLMIGISLFIAIISTILAPWIITLLFGLKYSGAVIILQIYVWSGIGLFVGVAINQYFLSENRSHTIFLYNLLSMSANVVLNIILIPRLGLTGAAWATLISYSAGPVAVGIIKWFSISKVRTLI